MTVPRKARHVFATRAPGGAADEMSPRRRRVSSPIVEIWVNPQCSKCRMALSELDGSGTEYTVRRYLEDPPTRDELTAVLDRLGLDPWDITRTGEPIATALGLTDWPRTQADRTRWLDALATHPILIQRPIITADDGTTVIGRTPEALRTVIPGQVAE